MNPDSIVSFFDANAVLIMFLWGFLHTRLPYLAKFPNYLVPWVNAIGYMLAQLAVPSAHASVISEAGAIVGVGAVAAKSAFTSAVVSLLYDKFFKKWLDYLLPPQR